jgi:hypothetical protein
MRPALVESVLVELWRGCSPGPAAMVACCRGPCASLVGRVELGGCRLFVCVHHVGERD